MPSHFISSHFAGQDMKTHEKEPLVHRANAAIKTYEANKHLAPESRSSDRPVQAMLFIMPVACFAAMMVVVYFYFYAQKALVMLILFVILFCCVIVATLADPRRRWLKYMGLFCFIGAIAGFSLGWYNHYKHMVYYYTYNSLRKYTNVAGSEPPQELGDAGMMSFTGDTHIDTTRAAGYKNAADGGHMYCVAPVLDSQQGGESPITFWAVGVDCCEPRAHFNCDDAGDGGAKSALILLDKEFLVPEDMEWAIEGLGESRTAFIEPMRLQQAAFGTIPAKQTTLIRWAKDPNKFKMEYKHKADHLMLVSIIVYAVISLFVSLFTAWALKPKRVGRAA